MTAELDHLVVGCLDLDAARAEFERLLGIPAQGGGAHEGRGTRNALWGLDGGARGAVYLEVIGPDPDQPAPRELPFGMSLPEIRARLAAGPCLLTWKARCDDIDARAARAAAAGVPLGPVEPMRRGDLRWRLTMAPDERALFQGAVPGLIQWPEGVTPPGALMAGSGLRLTEFARRPDAAAARALATLGLAEALPEADLAGAALRAVIETPTGRVVLERPVLDPPA